MPQIRTFPAGNGQLKLIDFSQDDPNARTVAFDLITPVVPSGGLFIPGLHVNYSLDGVFHTGPIVDVNEPTEGATVNLATIDVGFAQEVVWHWPDVATIMGGAQDVTIWTYLGQTPKVFIKSAGVYKHAIPYVFHSGAWRKVSPYVNTGGAWAKADDVDPV